MGETFSDMTQSILPRSKTFAQFQRECDRKIQTRMTECDNKVLKLEQMQRTMQGRLKTMAQKYGATKRSMLIPLAKAILVLERSQQTVMNTHAQLLTIQAAVIAASGMEIVTKSMADMGQMLTQMNGTVSLPKLSRTLQRAMQQQHLMSAKNDMLDETLSDMNASALDDELDNDKATEGDGTSAALLVDKIIAEVAMDALGSAPEAPRAPPQQPAKSEHQLGVGLGLPVEPIANGGRERKI